MKTILIVYLMLINLIGFAAMALDKRRAIRHKWRIPERTLFLIALLFGSIGVLTGMYVFPPQDKASFLFHRHSGDPRRTAAAAFLPLFVESATGTESLTGS